MEHFVQWCEGHAMGRQNADFACNKLLQTSSCHSQTFPTYASLLLSTAKHPACPTISPCKQCGNVYHNSILPIVLSLLLISNPFLFIAQGSTAFLSTCNMQTWWPPSCHKLQATHVNPKRLLYNSHYTTSPQLETIIPDTTSYTCTARLEAPCSMRYMQTPEKWLALFCTLGLQSLSRYMKPLHCVTPWIVRTYYEHYGTYTLVYTYSDVFPSLQSHPKALYSMARTSTC